MRGIRQYKKTTVNTSSPIQLIVLLYDGFLRYAHKAQAGLESGSPNVSGPAISKGLAIVQELRASLHHEKSPEFADQIAGLYEFIEFSLLDAQRQKSAESLGDVIQIMTELRDAWSQAARSVAENRAA